MKISDYCYKCAQTYNGVYCPGCTQKKKLNTDNFSLNEYELPKKVSFDLSYTFTQVEKMKMACENLLSDHLELDGRKIEIITDEESIYLVIKNDIKIDLLKGIVMRGDTWNYKFAQEILSENDKETVKRIFPMPEKAKREYFESYHPEFYELYKTAERLNFCKNRILLSSFASEVQDKLNELDEAA